MKKNTNNIFIVILIIILLIIFGTNIYLLLDKKTNNNDYQTVEKKIEEKIIETLSFDNGVIGYLKIDSIGLYAPIKEGTELSTLKEAIGHFSDSAYLTGNVCFAAHNRGNKQNFFEKLKDIKQNAEIIYITKYMEQKYYVSEIREIKETELSILNPTENNQITMVTCIENQREKRLCVIATEGSNI